MKDSTNFAKEFKLYEKLFNGTTKRKLRESRSVADIQSDIARLQDMIDKLQAELHKAQVAEKAVAYEDDFPTELFIWDAYLEPDEKGTWTSASLYKGEWDGAVYETEEEAVDAGYYHLQELASEDELYLEDEEGKILYLDPDEYEVEAVAVPLAEVSDDSLERFDLEHLIEFKRTLAGK